MLPGRAAGCELSFQGHGQLPGSKSLGEQRCLPGGDVHLCVGTASNHAPLTSYLILVLEISVVSRPYSSSLHGRKFTLIQQISLVHMMPWPLQLGEQLLPTGYLSWGYLLHKGTGCARQSLQKEGACVWVAGRDNSERALPNSA